MFLEGSTILVQVPAGVDAPLQPATVTAGGADRITVRFENRGVPVSSGAEVLVFRPLDGAFTRQPGRIETVLDDDPLRVPIVGLRTTGEPVAAEQRSSFRVSTAASGLTAEIDGEEACDLLDVSAAGFAVVSVRPHGKGDRVEATIRHDGRTYRGPAMVQSVRRLGAGRVRYGLMCSVEGADTELARGLRTMSAAIQRQQLRRRARREGA